VLLVLLVLLLVLLLAVCCSSSSSAFCSPCSSETHVNSPAATCFTMAAIPQSSQL
jgi:hypothetical protein